MLFFIKAILNLYQLLLLRIVTTLPQQLCGALGTLHKNAMCLAKTPRSCKPDQCKRVAELHGKSCVGGDGKFLSVLQDTRGFKACLTGLTQASSPVERNKPECLMLRVGEEVATATGKSSKP